jgi:hypothetical protein
MKLFGIELFSFKKDPEVMYDFAQHGLLSGNFGLVDNQVLTTTIGGMEGSSKYQRKLRPDATLISPKNLWKMGALNKNKFFIKVDHEYLKEQVAQIKEKLDLMGKRKKIKHNLNDFSRPMPSTGENGDVMFGRMELESILERLENRGRIAEFQLLLKKYPHTTSELVESIISNNSHLRCSTISGFVPDMPKEAIRAMKEYTDMCVNLCNKKPIFYIIAKHEDFQKKNAKRDPILLAQSPFGFFWQILGAWDEEMVYLGDL